MWEKMGNGGDHLPLQPAVPPPCLSSKKLQEPRRMFEVPRVLTFPRASLAQHQPRRFPIPIPPPPEVPQRSLDVPYVPYVVSLDTP